MRLVQQKIGQTIVEYALLITLVLAGVMVMGPYVVRSWNANVKGWEDSYQDSFQDPLGQPLKSTRMDCFCEYRKPCVDPPCCGYGSCLGTEDSEEYICDPVNCEPLRESICQEVKECCTTPVQLGAPEACGTAGCLDSEVPATYRCGRDNLEDPPRFECQFNPNCKNRCFGGPTPGDPAYAPDICPNDNINLIVNTPVKYVEKGECSAPDGSTPKCQWECAPGFVPGTKARRCECPEGFTLNENTCVEKTFNDVRGDCYTDTPMLDQIDHVPGCYRSGCLETTCDFEHKTLFSVGDTPNFSPDAYFFRRPMDWKVVWTGDECDVISGSSGNWCQMHGPGSWKVKAWVTHLPTGTNLEVEMIGVDKMTFSCQGCQ